MSNIEVTLTLDDSGFTTQITRNNQLLREFAGVGQNASAQINQMTRALTEFQSGQRRASDTSRSFLATARDMSIVMSTLSLAASGAGRAFDSWVGGIVRVNAEFERLETLMRGMSTALDPIADASGRLDTLIKTAQNAPFQLKTLADSMAKIQSTGTDPLNGSLQSLIDGVAAFGGTDEQFKRATLAITQMSGKGVIQMEELRQQLGEAMPEAVVIMARSLGVTMPQLIKDISTGTVDAKKALRAFTLEIDRSYGGKGSEMMETFNGRLQQMQTQFQILAKQVGDAGFMDELNKQLEDLIKFLSTDEAVVFATQLGQGFTSITQTIRTVLDYAIRFKDELKVIGVTVATVWAANRITSGIASFLTGIQTMRTQLRFLNAELQIARQAQALTAASQAAGTVLATTQGRVGTMMTAARGLASAFTALSPAIGVAAVAVVGLIEYFDVFNTKGREAYDTITNIGKAAREQFTLAKEFADNEVRDLQRERAELPSEDGRQRYVGREMRQRNGRLLQRFNPEEYQRQLAQANAEYDAMLSASEKRIEEIDRRITDITSTIGKAETDVLDGENRRDLDGFSKGLDKELNARNAAYNKLRRQTTEAGQAEIEEIDKSGRSSELARMRYQDRLKAQALAYYDDELRILREKEAEIRETLAKEKDEQQKVRLQARQNLVNERIAQALADRTSVQEQDAGTPKAAKALNDSKLFSKGTDALNRLLGDIAGLRAELSGAQGDVAELEVALKDGKFGDTDIPRVQELINKIREATAEKAALDEVMKGQKEFGNDITNANIKLAEREAEARRILSGKSETDADRLRRKWQEGGYTGLGPNSPIQIGMRQVVGLINDQGVAADRAGQVLRTNTFGDGTTQKLRTFNDELRDTVAILQRIASGGLGLQIPSINQTMGMPGMFAPAAAMESLPRDIADRMKVAMDLFMREGGLSEAAAAGIVGNLHGESRLDTSATGDSGRSRGIAQWKDERWTAMQAFAGSQGASPFDFQTQLRFVLKELRDNPGYGLNQLKIAGTPEQAAEIFMRKFERPAEWAIAQSGPGRASAARSALSMSGSAGTVPAQPVAYQPVVTPADVETQNAYNDAVKRFTDGVAGLEAREPAVKLLEQEAARKERNDEILRSIEEAKEEETGLNKNLSALQKVIRSGKLGDTKELKDPANAVYAAMIANAKELDRVEQEMSKRKKARTDIQNADEQFAAKRKELEARNSEALARIDDPLEAKSSRPYRQMSAELEAYVADVERFYGRDKQQYADAVAFKTQTLRQFRGTEQLELAAEWSKGTEEIKRSLMTESQARQANLDRELALIDQSVREFSGSEEQKVVVVAKAEERKAALRAKAASENPMSRQLRQWQDFSGNMERAQAQWMDSFATGISGLITGTGNLKSAIKGMISDIVNMGVRSMLGSMLGGMKGMGGGSKISKGTRSAISAGAVGLFHTGGLIGGPSAMTTVPHSVFAAARKFHSGGMIGGRSLLPDEVPIIARKGEGVFTPEQMRAMGGGVSMQAINISSPVTVNATGGKPEENEDLARQTAKAVDVQMRVIFQQELRKATRPGGIIRNRL